MVNSTQLEWSPPSFNNTQVLDSWKCQTEMDSSLESKLIQAINYANEIQKEKSTHLGLNL